MKKWFVLMIIFLWSPTASAIGPRGVSTTGQPVKWASMPVTVDLESDLDVRGKDMSPLISEAMNAWVNLTESDVVFSQASLGVAVDGSNLCCFLYESSVCPNSGLLTDGKNPWVFDEDGEITSSFFGSGNKLTTLGFASIITSNAVTGAAIKGEAVFNVACLKGVESSGCAALGLSFTDDDVTSFMVHEGGHFLGLDHSQVNLKEATDNDPSNDNLITTMYPQFIIGNGANFKTPERDDQVGLAQLYPSTTFSSSTWTITGKVSNTDGKTGLQCANVIARNTANPRVDAIAALSGDFAAAGVKNGDYQVLGLQPGASYTLEVEPIGSKFTGASGYTPCRGTNGESAPPQFTSQASQTTYTAAAGETKTGIDFTLSGVSALVALLDEEPAAIDIVNTSEAENAETRDIEDQIAAIELKSKWDSASCSSSATAAVTASSGGCSLIPESKQLY